MVTFRNNNRRPRFRSNDRSFKRTGDGSKYKSDFHTNGDFQIKSLSRNNHNASKLVEKYNNLAREALANEDHFTRILGEREKNQSIKEINDPATNKVHDSSDEKNKTDLKINKEVEKKNASS